MEKRVFLAAAVSALFLAVYSQLLSKQYQPSRKPQPTVVEQVIPATPDQSLVQLDKSDMQPIEDEAFITIQSDAVELQIGEASGTIRQATLKEFRSSDGNSPLQVHGSFPLLRVEIGSGKSKWQQDSVTTNTVSFNVEDSNVKKYHISYELLQDRPVLKLTAREENGSFTAPITLVSTWYRTDKLHGRNNILESILLTVRGNGQAKHEKHLETPKREKIVPRGTLLATLSERYFCSSIRPSHGTFAVTLLPASLDSVAFRATSQAIGPTENPTFSAELYFGPRDYFKLRQAKFGDAVPVGALGQIGLILLWILHSIAKLTGNYGIAIMLFSILVTLSTAPFTLMSLRSMKKMQELKPQIDRLMAQHKSDPTRANKEVFALYKQNRVNPLSGCLPMFFQLPIFFALFQAITHFVELRGQSFLWIKDLSLPDRLTQLPFTLPILGNDLNLLPFVMAGAMYLQTKASQARMPTDPNNPSAKMLQGPMMSIVFGVMLYQVPAGLVLYWLTNSLASLTLYKIVK